MRPKKAIEFQIFDTPGFHRISYFNSAEGSTNNFSTKPEQRIRAKIKLPLWNAPSFKVAAGFYYNNEEFTLYNHYSVPNVTELELKKVKANITFLKLLDAKNYLVLRGEIDASGDFEGITRDPAYRNSAFSVFWGHKKNQKTEFGLGLIYRNGFIRTRILPLLIYNHNFSDKWGIELALPQGINLRHNCSKRSNFSIQSSIRTNRYLIKDNNEVINNKSSLLFNRAELRTGIAFQKKIVSLIWTEVSAGIKQDINLFSDNPAFSSLSSNQSSSTYFAISFFVTPPSRNR